MYANGKLFGQDVWRHPAPRGAVRTLELDEPQLAQSPDWRSWYFLGLLCLIGVLSIIDRQVLNVLVKPIREELHISDVQIGILQGIGFGLSYALFAMPLAFIADKGNRRWLIAVCLVIWGIMTALAGFATGFGMLLVTRMFVGIGEAALHPATFSLVADIFPRRWLNRAVGIFGASVSLSPGLSILVGGLVAGMFTAGAGVSVAGLTPWRLTLITVALPAPLLALILVGTTREPARPRASADAPLAGGFSAGLLWAELRRRRGFVMLMIAGSAFAQILQYAQMSWFPTSLMRERGLPMGSLAFALGIPLIASGTIGPIVSGLVADRFQARRGLEGPCLILSVAIGGALLQAGAALVSSTSLSLALFVLGYLFFSGSILLVPSILQAAVRPDLRGRISGIWVTTVQLVGLSVGPLAVPLMARVAFGRTDGIGQSLAMTSGICFIAMSLFYLLALVRAGEDPGP